MQIHQDRSRLNEECWYWKSYLFSFRLFSAMPASFLFSYSLTINCPIRITLKRSKESSIWKDGIFRKMGTSRLPGNGHFIETSFSRQKRSIQALEKPPFIPLCLTMSNLPIQEKTWITVHTDWRSGQSMIMRCSESAPLLLTAQTEFISTANWSGRAEPLQAKQISRRKTGLIRVFSTFTAGTTSWLYNFRTSKKHLHGE